MQATTKQLNYLNTLTQKHEDVTGSSIALCSAVRWATGCSNQEWASYLGKRRSNLTKQQASRLIERLLQDIGTPPRRR